MRAKVYIVHLYVAFKCCRPDDILCDPSCDTILLLYKATKVDLHNIILSIRYYIYYYKEVCEVVEVISGSTEPILKTLLPIEIHIICESHNSI